MWPAFKILISGAASVGCLMQTVMCIPHFFRQNMSDAMAILHKLQTGLDVNVKFTGVRVFEYTPECIVFDLLDIPLYHGWLVDPQVSRLSVLPQSPSGLCFVSEKLWCTLSTWVPSVSSFMSQSGI